MNYLKTDPVGIDVNINNIQSKIYEPLVASWGDLDVYGRVYKIPKKNGKVSLEAYLGKGEYEKVLFSEGNKIFFVQGLQPDISSGVSTNDLWVVCILNLDDVKSGINHRADEEVHQDLMTELSNVVMLDNIKSIEYDMDNLKRVVEEAFDFDSFNYTDIHPYHVFMVKLEVNYALIKNNC